MPHFMSYLVGAYVSIAIVVGAVIAAYPWLRRDGRTGREQAGYAVRAAAVGIVYGIIWPATILAVLFSTTRGPVQRFILGSKNG